MSLPDNGGSPSRRLAFAVEAVKSSREAGGGVFRFVGSDRRGERGGVTGTSLPCAPNRYTGGLTGTRAAGSVLADGSGKSSVYFSTFIV